MSNVNDRERRLGWPCSFLLVETVLIFAFSPLLWRLYEGQCEGEPLVPLTCFALHTLPILLLLFTLAGVTLRFAMRHSKKRKVLSALLAIIALMALIVYALGVMVPYIHYPVGIKN